MDGPKKLPFGFKDTQTERKHKAVVNDCDQPSAYQQLQTIIHNPNAKQITSATYARWLYGAEWIPAQQCSRGKREQERVFPGSTVETQTLGAN